MPSISFENEATLELEDLLGQRVKLNRTIASVQTKLSSASEDATVAQATCAGAEQELTAVLSELAHLKEGKQVAPASITNLSTVAVEEEEASVETALETSGGAPASTDNNDSTVLSSPATSADEGSRPTRVRNQVVAFAQDAAASQSDKERRAEPSQRGDDAQGSDDSVSPVDGHEDGNDDDDSVDADEDGNEDSVDGEEDGNEDGPDGNESDSDSITAEQEHEVDLAVAVVAVEEARDERDLAVENFESCTDKVTVLTEKLAFYNITLTTITQSIDQCKALILRPLSPQRPTSATAAPATGSRTTTTTATAATRSRPTSTPISESTPRPAAPITFNDVLPAPSPIEHNNSTSESDNTFSLHDASGAELMFTNGKEPHFKTPTSVPGFYGDVQHFEEDQLYFDLMRNTLILANLWISIQFHPLPPYMWALTAACFATLASSAKSHKAKQLVLKHRPAGAMSGNPKALWDDFQDMVDPLDCNPTLLQSLKDTYMAQKMTTTDNPYFDLENFQDNLEQKATKISNLTKEGWQPTNEMQCTLLRRNLPPTLNMVGLSLHVKFLDFDTSYKTLLQLASEYNANNGISTFDTAGAKALSAGASSGARASKFPSRAVAVKPSSGSFCDWQGHPKPDAGYSGTGPWFTPGHKRTECKGEKKSKTNGDPRKSKKAPGPKACHNCGSFQHLKSDCPTGKLKKAQALIAKSKQPKQQATAAAATPQQPTPSVATPPGSLPAGFQWQAMPVKAAALVAAGLLTSATGAEGASPFDDVYAPGVTFVTTTVPDVGPLTAVDTIDTSDSPTVPTTLNFDFTATLPANATAGFSLYHSDAVNTGSGTFDSGANWGVVPIDVVLQNDNFFPWFDHFPRTQIPTDVFFGNSSSGSVETWLMGGLVGQYRTVKYTDGTTGVRIYGPFLPTKGATHFLQSIRQHVKLYKGSRTVQDEHGMRIQYSDGKTVDLLDNGHGLYDLPKIDQDGTMPAISQAATPSSWAAMASAIPDSTNAEASALAHFPTLQPEFAQVLAAQAVSSDLNYDKTWYTMLRSFGLSDAEAQREVALQHAQRADECNATQTALSKTRVSDTYARYASRFGYRNHELIQQMATEDGVTLTGRDKHFDVAKFRGSAHRKPMKRPKDQEQFVIPHPRYALFMDDVPGMPPSVHDKFTGFMLITATTGLTRIYPSKTLNTKDALTATTQYLTESGFHTPTVRYGPQLIRTDTAKIFDNDTWDTYVAGINAKHIRSAPNDQLQNHIAENEVRIVMQMTLCMLHAWEVCGFKLDRMTFWPQAMLHACHVKALTPRSAGKPSPYQVETTMKPDRSVVRASFGAKCVVTTVSELRGKMQSHARLAFYMGSSDHAHPDTFLCFALDTRQFCRSRNVSFDPSAPSMLQPSVYDYHINLGDWVYDPSTATTVKVLDPESLQQALPPPPPPPPLPPQLYESAYKPYQSITRANLTDEALSELGETPPLPIPPPPPTSIPPPLQKASKTKTKKSFPTDRFEIGMKVEVDFGPIDGFWPATIIRKGERSVQIEWTTLLDDDGKHQQLWMRNNSLKNIHPAQPPPQPQPKPSKAEVLAATLNDFSTATQTAFKEIAMATADVVTMAANTIPTTLLCAALLVTAMVPQPAVLGLAMTTTTQFTDNDFFDQDVLMEHGHELAFAFNARPQYSMRTAQKTDNAAGYNHAADAELQGLRDDGTWHTCDISDIPSTGELIDTKMILTEKFDANGAHVKFKGRLVALGNQTTFGKSYLNSNAPTPTFDAVRTFLSVSAINDYDVLQYDFTRAFTSSDLDNVNVYLRFEPGIRQYRYSDGELRKESTFGNETGIEQVGHCLKSIYGLPQSFCNMNEDFRSLVTANGWIQSKCEPSLFTKRTKRIGKPDHVSMVLIFVDDLAVATTPSNPDHQELQRLMATRFTVTGGDDIGFYLGCDVHRHRQNRSLTIDQQQMIRDTCQPYIGTSPAKRTPTVLPTKFVASKADCPQTEVEQRQFKKIAANYRMTLGKLLWIHRCTRPDIGHAMSVLGRYASNPGPAHVKALRHVCHYLMNTIDVCLEYGPVTGTVSNTVTGYEKFLDPSDDMKDQDLVGFVDADWGTCTDTRRSQSGFVALLNNGPIAWTSRKQPIVAMSTMESELIAITAGSLHVVYLRQLLADLGAVQDQPTVMHEDNKATIAVAHNKSVNSASRHIALRHFKVKELMADGTIYCQYCPSAFNRADILTKNVDQNTLSRHNRGMMGSRF